MDSKSMFGIGVGVRLLMGLSNPRKVKDCLPTVIARSVSDVAISNGTSHGRCAEIATLRSQ